MYTKTVVMSPDSRARLRGLIPTVPFPFVALDNVSHLSVTDFSYL